MNKIIIAVCLTATITIWLFAMAFNSAYGKGNKNYDLIQFAQQKPELVRALKIKYEEQVKQIEANLVKNEKTPQDKLIEAVTDQLDPKN